MNKTKTKLSLLVAVTGIFFAAIIFLSIGTQKAFAVSCSAQKPGFACIDTSSVTGATGCVANLCPGTANAVQCCPLASITTCKAPLQQCSANGNYGICNSAGECIDAGSGPIGGSSAPPTGDGTNFTNPLGNIDTIDKFLTNIMSALQKIIVTLALVMIVFGAVLYVTSGGSSKQIETAKAAIVAALVGLAIGIAAPSLLKELSTIMGFPGASAMAGLSLSAIAVNVLNFLLGILGILSLVMLVIGAIMYLTSAGDETRIDIGKNIFKNALLGVIIAMSAMIMVTQIAAFFTGATPASPAPGSSSTTGVCAGKAVGSACKAYSDNLSWDGTCNSDGSCQQAATPETPAGTGTMQWNALQARCAANQQVVNTAGDGCVTSRGGSGSGVDTVQSNNGVTSR